MSIAVRGSVGGKVGIGGRCHLRMLLSVMPASGSCDWVVVSLLLPSLLGKSNAYCMLLVAVRDMLTSLSSTYACRDGWMDISAVSRWGVVSGFADEVLSKVRR